MSRHIWRTCASHRFRNSFIRVLVFRAFVFHLEEGAAEQHGGDHSVGQPPQRRIHGTRPSAASHSSRVQVVSMPPLPAAGRP